MKSDWTTTGTFLEPFQRHEKECQEGHDFSSCPFFKAFLKELRDKLDIQLSK